MLDTDIPYLEPLLFWLRNDPSLKEEFTEKSFFMPHNHLIAATKEAMAKDCPAPRALHILPGDNVALSLKSNCHTPVEHSFYILIFVQCIRDQFNIFKKDGEVYLGGQFMELSELKKKVKKSILEFGKDWDKKNPYKKFNNIIYRGDQPLYPDDENKFLVAKIDYTVSLL